MAKFLSVDEYVALNLQLGNRWLNREPFVTGRARVKLVKCPSPGCMKGEFWDSEIDTNDHFVEYHPDADWYIGVDNAVYIEPPTSDVVIEDIHWSEGYAPGSFEATFAALYQEAFALLVERQKKYGPENIRQLGLWGVFGRFADDKVNRIRRAFNGTIRKGVMEVELKDGDFDDESLEDALLDSVNYPLIMLALKRDLWGHPLEEDID